MECNRISIIVPAYNIEEYITNTVKSICYQTYKNIEIILVNDGSTDNTGMIIDKLALKDERIKVIHKENGGVTSARLRGIQEATGEWIGFVDGDDYIEPQMYEMLLNNAIEYEAQISHCGYQMVFPNRVDMYYGTGKLVVQDNNIGLKDLLQGEFVEPGVCNKLYNKRVIEKFCINSKMDLSIKNTEDLLMNYFLFRESEKSVFIDECPYHYMIRKGSATTGKMSENKLKDPLKVLNILEVETQNATNLNLIVNKRILNQLISISATRFEKDMYIHKAFLKYNRKVLRKKFWSIIRGNYSGKQKIQTVWVLISPLTYYIVKKWYLRISGLDKKYEIF